jgi:hypothetical protein
MRNTSRESAGGENHWCRQPPRKRVAVSFRAERGRSLCAMADRGRKNQSEIPRSALLKITTLASFPRKRESTGLGPRFRGGDESDDFRFLGWAAGPWKLRRKSRHSRESGNPAPPGDLDPRLRGGDEGLTFITTGGRHAHRHSE